MWHEEKFEMKTMLKSIFKMDEHQYISNIVSKTKYDYEGKGLFIANNVC